MSNIFLGDKLEEPLSKIDLINEFKKMNNGDYEARDNIINHNIRLVYNIVYKMISKDEEEKKELFSIGLIGLIKSVDTFDINKSISFSTYATRCINNEIFMYFRKKKHKDIEYNLEERLSEDNDISKMDFLKSDINIEEDYEKKYLLNRIKELVNNLTGIEKEIVNKYFGFDNDEPIKQLEIARELHTSQANISRVIRNVLTEISKELKREGLLENSVYLDNRKIRTEIESFKYKKYRTIYEMIPDYTEREINIAIESLNEEDKRIIYLRYGEDLHNPASESLLNTDINKDFNSRVIPKIKRRLNTNRESKMNVKVSYLNILNRIRNIDINKLGNYFTASEFFIISLRLGLINDKFYSTEEISKFLKIDQDYIRSVINKLSMVLKSKKKLIDYINDPVNEKKYFKDK